MEAVIDKLGQALLDAGMIGFQGTDIISTKYGHIKLAEAYNSLGNIVGAIDTTSNFFTIFRCN